jgi:hypothetical protein
MNHAKRVIGIALIYAIQWFPIFQSLPWLLGIGLQRWFAIPHLCSPVGCQGDRLCFGDFGCCSLPSFSFPMCAMFLTRSRSVNGADS